MKRVPPADPGQLPLDLGGPQAPADDAGAADDGASEPNVAPQPPETSEPELEEREELEPAEPAPGAKTAIAGRPALRLGRGPRAVEGDLLRALAEWNEQVAAEPALLAAPFRIVVPSSSLRDHVAAAALRHFGRPLLGVSIQTLFASALEVLERSGAEVRTARSLVSVEVARHSAQESALSSALGSLRGSSRIVEATVKDLLDAGLRADDAERLEEALEAHELEGAHVDRARATVRIASTLLERLDSLGVQHRSQLLTSAAEELWSAPGLLPSSHVAIHGFAEATGAATVLLEAMTRAHPTTIWIDEPAEPGNPNRIDPGARFAHRLRDRFAPIAISTPQAPAESQSPTRVAELFAAPGAEAEIRAVAGRIRQLLDEDPALEPERIGVVARQLGNYAPLVRAHFGRLGIPYSGAGASVPRGALARRVAAVAALLAEGEDCPADRWVGALDSVTGNADAPLTRALRADLRLALRHLGTSRLRDVAVLAAPKGPQRLPARSGLAAQEEERGPVAQYRRLEASVLSGAIERAQSLCDRLAGWSERESAAGHEARLKSLLEEDLGWERESASAPQAEEFSALDELARELPNDFELSRSEFFELAAERLLASQTREPVGGCGGGVALLGVMEARARTFEHVFVLGLNRDVFPRPVTEDALLPDSLRRELARDLLPDLPIKATGHDEERYLFAQLFASSSNVVLSWLSTSDDGKKRVRSTLVDRLVGAEGMPQPTTVPSLHQLGQLSAPGPRTARELAQLAGVEAEGETYAALVAPALAEAWARDGANSANSADEVAAVAAARVAVAREFSRAVEGNSFSVIGPYFGLLGEATEASDLRRAKRYVTSLERMSRCGWQTALQKLLRLEATPDPLDQFPELTPLVVGSVVHAALEEVLGSGASESLDLPGAIARGPQRRSWPGDEELHASARRCAERTLHDEGLTFAGLIRVLADRVFDHLVRARELWEGGAVDVLAVEVEGGLEVRDGAASHAVAFKADMVESVGGITRLTDFKTGPYRGSRAVGIETRHKNFAEDVASGRTLQAVAYALAAGQEGAIGRYLFVRPDVPTEFASSEFEVGGANDAAVRAAFDGAVKTLGRAWDAGVFVPRMTDAGHSDGVPRACGYCEVKEACLQGDAGLRQRQRSFVSRGTAGSASERIYTEFWNLGSKGGGR